MLCGLTVNTAAGGFAFAAMLTYVLLQMGHALHAAYAAVIGMCWQAEKRI